MPPQRGQRFKVKRHTVVQPSDPSYRLIPLTQGRNAIVDTADFEWLSQYNWCVTKAKEHISYAATWHKQRMILMHDLIMSPESGQEVDHRDHDGLNNRRHNLHCCSHNQNLYNTRKRRDNTSGYRGVCWYSREQKWVARFNVESRTVCVGYFDSAEEAAKAYDNVIQHYHGEFSVLNFPH